MSSGDTSPPGMGGTGHTSGAAGGIGGGTFQMSDALELVKQSQLQMSAMCELAKTLASKDTVGKKEAVSMREIQAKYDAIDQQLLHKHIPQTALEVGPQVSAALLRSSFGGSPSSGSSPRLCGPAGRWRGERVGGARHLRSPVVAGPFLRLLGPCCLLRGESRNGEGGKSAPSSEYYVLYCMSRLSRASGRGASCVLDLLAFGARRSRFLCVYCSVQTPPPQLRLLLRAGRWATASASPTYSTQAEALGTRGRANR